MAEAALSCPVCFTAFAASEGSAFALHVSSCSSTSPPASPTVPSHCPLCFHVYASGTLAHEISFHEHECGRVNDLQEDEQQGEEDQGATNTQDSRKAKRPRNARSSSSSAAAAVTLFPSTCFLCGNGGRGLLRCGGSCARAAHQHCVDDLQAPAAGDPLSVAEKKQAQEKWRCAHVPQQSSESRTNRTSSRTKSMQAVSVQDTHLTLTRKPVTARTLQRQWLTVVETCIWLMQTQTLLLERRMLEARADLGQMQVDLTQQTTDMGLTMQTSHKQRRQNAMKM
ncbi:hypothetical protein PHYBOEH_002151 [Phytophthora boehmeriae]|uniref:Zinc finger PHD-type domain-containing protein n=1 Tax=Phytophthora boehmeriae TaxID=109152 RepID=A0A8T1WXL4_9STRA|nr:hypothetical protein PHYBOEH_002151 [Phytophthora boehmeriae]